MKRLIFFLLIIALLVSGCGAVGNIIKKVPGMYYEATETDIFAIKEVLSTDITVKGIRLGDSEKKVISKLGEADKRNTDFIEEGIINLEYRQSLNLNQTGLIINLKEGKVNRITMLEPFNIYLKGKTKIENRTKKDTLKTLGAYDNIIYVGNKFRILQYKEKGFEIILKKTNIDRISLLYPNEQGDWINKEGYSKSD